MKSTPSVKDIKALGEPALYILGGNVVGRQAAALLVNLLFKNADAKTRQVISAAAPGIVGLVVYAGSKNKNVRLAATGSFVAAVESAFNLITGGSGIMGLGEAAVFTPQTTPGALIRSAASRPVRALTPPTRPQLPMPAQQRRHARSPVTGHGQSRILPVESVE